ncbi:pyroglutamylated RF-amide peptide receptor isoform X1 [Silurus meridionalis]|uniref:pyroglutamylated RF-amide peptide receptor isoform X1 n=1 Tax=Silurus meridionalis TaxID=175797 RepID=UPI001EEB1325|nr:pyroglutamylated RF-amide peptide receptor isoform X1 [Silurus meridionalis]XP_046723129.1 pyroglutamylated RF-amide peptide receptor isoform X1 [Silurus meridionalis]
MNLTSDLLDMMLKASNLSRWQFIQHFSIPPLVSVPRLPAALVPVFGLLYVLIFLLAVVGNGAVLVLMCRKKALQSPSTFFICSLALSDLLIGIVCVPASLLQHFFNNWLAGDFLCKLVPFLQVTAIATSILTMTCIAVERFQGILYPLHVRNSYILHSSIMMVVAVWLVALAIAAPMWFVQKVEVKYDFLFEVQHTSCLEVWPSLQWRRTYTVCLSVMVFLVPMVTMAILYGKIMGELWGKHRIHEAVFQTLPGSEINKITRRKRKAVKMMATVVLLFGVCWAPFHLVSLLLDYENLNLNLDSELLLLSLVQILGFSNSVCNPVVYAALNTNFKKDLLALLTQRWSLCFRRRKPRVGISITEPRTTAERTERRVRVQPWSKVAWEMDNGVAPVTNGARSEYFNPMNLLGAIWPSNNSSTVILNVTDPLHIDATYRSDQKTAGIPSG